MKSLTIVLLFLSVNQIAFCQKDISEFDKDGLLEYQVIDSQLNLNKSQLFDISKNWIIRTFENGGKGIQSEDREAGIIVGFMDLIIPKEYKISTDSLSKASDSKFDKNLVGDTIVKKYNEYYKAIYQINVKDEKVRMKIYDFQYKNDFSSNGYQKISEVTQRRVSNGMDPYGNLFAEMNNSIQSILKSFSNFVTQSTSDDF